MRMVFFFLLPLAMAQAQESAPVVVDVFDFKTLQQLENSGFSFADQMGKSGARSNKELSGSGWYADFSADLSRELAGLEATYAANGRGTVDAGHQFVVKNLARNGPETGAKGFEVEGEGPRIFDSAWLSSGIASFRLMAVVNRYDRKDFDGISGSSCGETRLIYRLAYKTANQQSDLETRKKFPQVKSSLPFFVNLVFRNRKTAAGCLESLKRWVPPAKDASAAWLAQGPLSGTNIEFQQLEVNFQALRFSSGYMKDFGGQAMYMLKIFAERSGHLEAIPMESTPDVAALWKDPALRQSFLSFLSQNSSMQSLDQGVLKIDPSNPAQAKFLAKKAMSWATLGKARLANKPYNEIFTAKDFSAVDFSQLKFLRSGQGILERLNGISCMGCHQSNSTAGFHILGFGYSTGSASEEPMNEANSITGYHNQAAIPFSPHYYAERGRRSTYYQKLLADPAGKNPPSPFRPLPSFPQLADGRFEAKSREPCLPASQSKHFSLPLSCAEGLKCVITAKIGLPSAAENFVQFGECVPQPGTAAFSAGAVCRAACVRPSAENARSSAFFNSLPSGEASSLFDFRDFAVSGSRDGQGCAGEPLAGVQALLFDADALKEKGFRCGAPTAGVPLGRISQSCAPEDFHFKGLSAVLEGEAGKAKLPPAFCAIQGSTAFSKCADKLYGTTCLESEGSARGMLDLCYEGNFCREDYICQALPWTVRHFVKDESVGGNMLRQVGPRTPEDDRLVEAIRKNRVGFCTPTYFVFNMRVDGHPTPAGDASDLKLELEENEYRGGFPNPGGLYEVPKYMDELRKSNREKNKGLREGR